MHLGWLDSVDRFPKAFPVAGVILSIFGNPTSALRYCLAVRTASGGAVFAERVVGPGWVVGGHLCPIVPASRAITGTGLTVVGAEPLKSMSVWVIDEETNAATAGKGPDGVQALSEVPPVTRQSATMDLTRDRILDHIRGGWTGMLIGGIEGLATGRPRSSPTASPPNVEKESAPHRGHQREYLNCF